MVQGIVENDQVHLLVGVFLVEFGEAFIGPLLDVFDGGTGLIHIRCLLDQLFVVIVDVVAHEVGEQVLRQELLIFESERLPKLILGRLVKHILECLLVILRNELINEGSLGFVTPETDQEESRVGLILQLLAIGDNLVLVSLSYARNSTEHTRQLTNREVVMEFGGRGQQSLRSLLPQADRGVDKHGNHRDDLI